ncbi:MAG: hemin uptake protein HemP [Pseudolabrys sp.]
MADDKTKEQSVERANKGAGYGNTGAASTGGRRSIAVGGDRIDSRDLFIGTREIIIEHGDDHYRLRLTAQNKLILTK